MVKIKKKLNISKFRRTNIKWKPNPRPPGYSGNRHLAKMAEASEPGSIDLASLLRANKVEALHTTALCGLVRFLVWTRLSEEGSSWIIKWVFFFPIFLPYFLCNYLLLGRPILKLIRPLSIDEQIPTHRVRANSLFLQVNRGKITDSYQSSVGKQVRIPRNFYFWTLKERHGMDGWTHSVQKFVDCSRFLADVTLKFCTH